MLEGGLPSWCLVLTCYYIIGANLAFDGFGKKFGHFLCLPKGVFNNFLYANELIVNWCNQKEKNYQTRHIYIYIYIYIVRNIIKLKF